MKAMRKRCARNLTEKIMHKLLKQAFLNASPTRQIKHISGWWKTEVKDEDIVWPVNWSL